MINCIFFVFNPPKAFACGSLSPSCVLVYSFLGGSRQRLRQAGGRGGWGGGAAPRPFANLPHQIIHDQLYICFALTPLMRLHVALSFLYFGEHA